MDQMNLPGHVSYIYLGGDLTTRTVTPNTVIAYENPIDTAGSNTAGSNVLFGDYHVEFMDSKWVTTLIAKAATTQPVTIPSE